MLRVGVCGLVVCVVAASTSADPPDAYEPPPFSRFPDEPADLPPPRIDPTSPAWLRVEHAVLREARIRIVAAADAPLDLAAGGELDIWRLRFGATVGELPRWVERGANNFLVDHGAYDRPLGDLVVGHIQRVVLVRGYLALEPWPSHGLLLTAGMATTTIDVSATVPQIAAAIGMALPDGVPLGTSRFAISTRLHLFDAEVGWEWRWRRWSLQLDLGIALATSTRTRAAAQTPYDDPRITQFADRAAATLDHAFGTYVKTPILATLVGYDL